jgi:hypothetical protein
MLWLETQSVHRELAEEFEQSTQRWRAIAEEHKFQVAAWYASRPHSRKIEKLFFKQDKAILVVDTEFRSWLRDYSSSLREYRDKPVLPSESDRQERLSDIQKVRGELVQILQSEIPRLSEILNRFEGAVRTLGKFNS